MQLPGSERYIRKSTRLQVRHLDTMQALSRLCDGVGKHEHHVVAGHWPGIPSVSQFAGQYPPQFVKAVLHTVPAFRDRASHRAEVLEVIEDDLKWMPPPGWQFDPTRNSSQCS